MTRLATLALASALWLPIGFCGCAMKPLTPQGVLTKASESYRDLGAFRGSLRLTVAPPGGEPTERTIEFGVGPEGVFVDAGFQRLVAAGDRIMVIQADAEDKYVSAPYNGDFGAAVASIGGEQLQIPDLPPIVLRQSGELSDWLDSFGLRVLGPVELADGVSVRAEGLEILEEITMLADNGTVRAGFARDTGFLVSLEIEATPAGAPPGMRVQATGHVTTQPLETLGDHLQLDLDGRTAVMDLAALNAESFKIGTEVRTRVLESIRGARIDLKDLRGKVVVFDFWASWCLPCWSSLEGFEQVVTWAETSGLPVAVWAVNTSEGVDTLTAQRGKIAPLWQRRGFAMDSLVDTGGELFASIGAPGLPSTVVISPEGTLASVHLGVLADARSTLEDEVRALLGLDS